MGDITTYITTCITISPDKECLATVDSGGIYLLDLTTGKLRWSLKIPIKSRDRHDQIAFSPDGQLLAFTDKYVGRTSELDFSADGSRLRTNRGMWPLPGASDSLSQPLSTIPADLVVIGESVIWKMARVLWIPHHLHVLNTVVTGNVVGFVSQSGPPIWIGFDLSKRPTDEALVNQLTWEDITDREFEEVS